MSDPVQRVNFFDHQFLHVEDFQTEQTYHIEARQRHNRYLHTPGVAYGLRVAQDGASTTAVTISEGMALDADGQEIVVTDTQTLELGTFDADKSLWVVISYDSHTGRQTNETGVAGDTRLIEEPSIQALAQKAMPSGSGRIVLALVARTGTAVTSVDESPRTLAGSMEGDVNLTPQNPAVPQTQWVTLSWSAANRADLSGTLNIRKPASSSEGNLNVDGNLALGGNETVAGTLRVGGAAALSSALAVAGQFTVAGAAALSSAVVSGQLSVAGATTLSGTLAVAGPLSTAGLTGLGVPAPRARLDVGGQGFFRSAPWAGGVPLATAAASAGLAAGFDPANGGGSGFLQAVNPAGASTRLWLDGDPIIFAPRGAERGRLDFLGNVTLAGGLAIDSGNTNAGANISTAVPGPYVVFGGASGEGIGSKRTAGGNLWGLDFYTASVPRLSILNGGQVGIGTQAPQAQLHVAGGGDIRWANSILSTDQGGSIELGARNGVAGLSATQVPYIDFHFGNVAQDYNVRLINDADQRLTAQAGVFRQNYLCLSGGVNWSSIAYNAHHASGAWAYLDPSRKAMTIEMDDSGGTPRFQLFSNPGGNPNQWLLCHSVDGTSGHTGIGPGGSSAAYMLYISGTAAATGWATTSDQTLKKNVRHLTGVLDDLRTLDGVRFEWKKTAMRSAGLASADSGAEGEQIGLLAQQVEERFPQLVTTWEGSDGETYRALDYTRMNAVIIEAIKELADRVDALAARIDESTKS